MPAFLRASWRVSALAQSGQRPTAKDQDSKCQDGNRQTTLLFHGSAPARVESATGDVTGFAVPFSGGDLLECVPEIASALIMHTFVRNSQALLPRSPAHSFFD